MSFTSGAARYSDQRRVTNIAGMCQYAHPREQQHRRVGTTMWLCGLSHSPNPDDPTIWLQRRMQQVLQSYSPDEHAAMMANDTRRVGHHTLQRLPPRPAEYKAETGFELLFASAPSCGLMVYTFRALGGFSVILGLGISFMVHRANGLVALGVLGFQGLRD